MPKKIFLVEDDTAIADIYKMMMEKSGWKVQAFSLGADVLRAVKESKPDAVLLDLALPDMNGADVLKEIRSNESTKDTRVFILTNQSDVTFEDSAKPDKVIIKANITPTQLVEVLQGELT